MRREGATLAFSYQSEKLQARVEKLAAELGSDITLPLDVAEDAQIDAFFAGLAAALGRLRHPRALGGVRAGATSSRGAISTRVSREGFRIAHDISSYSLAALAKKVGSLYARARGCAAHPELPRRRAGAAELQRYGRRESEPRSERALPCADLGPVGIRVNAISAGPIRTLAASGVKGIRQMIALVGDAAPLKRNVTIEDVGNAAAFLCSDLAAGITGQVVYVDAGFNIVGMSFPDEGADTRPSE